MRKILLLIMLFLSVGISAQIKDAFKSVCYVIDGTHVKSLNGSWNLKVIKGSDWSNYHDFYKSDYDFSDWGKIPVPGNCEIYGYNKASYTYPNDITGFYRTSFDVPKEWMGNHIMLRFDGVLRGYELWINGEYVDKWESGYNTCIFDITKYIKEKNILSMRVYSRFKGYEFDCFDDWAPMGIFRDVTLFSVPDRHLKDVIISTTSISADKAVMDFKFVASSFKGKKADGMFIKADICNIKGDKITDFALPLAVNDTADKHVTIDNPMLWNAETPNLYVLKYSLNDKKGVLQNFEQRFGIRLLTIDNNIIKINGSQVKFRGVTLHATDPQNGKVIGESLNLKDMKMMKEANINYIRTSHYPREPRFYDLCDSLGFYVIDEVPFGKGDDHLTDKSYQDILLTRADATVRRDKNHPCVMIWSIGNENPFTKICDVTGQYVKMIDHTRPICYPMIGSYFNKLDYKLPASVDIFAPHYPMLSTIKEYAKTANSPFIFTEYCHTLGQSLEDHNKMWELIEQNPILAGGSVWEWVDQGMPFKDARTDFFRKSEDVWTSEKGGFTMCGNQGTDGLLYADRTPLPNYYELQRNYAQAQVLDTCISVATGSNNISINVRNRYDFINLKNNVTFNWTLTADRDTVQKGSFSPDCAPHHQSVENISLNIPKDKLSLLQFDIKNKNGLTINRQTVKINGNFDLVKMYQSLKVGNGNPFDYVQGKPLWRIGRKISLSESCKVSKQVAVRYLMEPKSIAKSRYIYEDSNIVAEGTIDIKDSGNGKSVRFSLKPEKSKKLLLETGLAFLLDKSIDKVQWVGYGPYASYPGKMSSNNYGYYSMTAGDLYFEGNRMGVDAALMTDDAGNGILLTCKNGKINFEQTDKGIVVTCNAYVSGIGPKSKATSYPVYADKISDISGSLILYKVAAGDNIPLMLNAKEVKQPFRHFLSEYDTYLLKYEDIISR